MLVRISTSSAPHPSTPSKHLPCLKGVLTKGLSSLLASVRPKHSEGSCSAQKNPSEGQHFSRRPHLSAAKRFGVNTHPLGCFATEGGTASNPLLEHSKCYRSPFGGLTTQRSTPVAWHFVGKAQPTTPSKHFSKPEVRHGASSAVLLPPINGGDASPCGGEGGHASVGSLLFPFPRPSS
jgi:hypothetical protein